MVHIGRSMSMLPPNGRYETRVKLRRSLGRLDAWVDPVVELWAGCILVLSASFWISPAHAIWDPHHLLATVGSIIVGPLLVYRPWTRKLQRAVARRRLRARNRRFGVSVPRGPLIPR